MKPPLLRVLALLAAPALAGVLAAQTPPPKKIDFPAPSPASTLKQRVGLTDITVEYSRPGLKGRVLVGNINPYGEVWRVGANEATRITFSAPVTFGGTPVPAGTYGLFAIPGPSEWTVILNKNAKQWGAYQYDAKDDVVRVPATAAKIDPRIETFTIDINDIRDESATLNLIWDGWRVPVKLGVDVLSVLEPQIEAVMASDAPKKPYAQAAMFYGDHGVHLDEAVKWMDAAIAAQPDFDFYLYYHKGIILAKMGDKAGALAAAQKSLELVAKATGPEKGEYIRLDNALIASLH
ncbi:MAG TPA: DUF2911 domain-containing protein [Opitutaceae bacterium]|nr:DUF2911 domain-containing protein [Opitutaceae bacterium]